MMAMDARYVCAKVIQEVIDQGSHLDHALAHHSGKLTHSRDRALAQELCYGTLRWYHRLAFVLGKLLEKPLKSRDNDIQALLCSGLYQMGYLRIPDHAAISATVETARTLGKSWACDLVNAVLRRYQREKAVLDQLANDSEPAHFSHPQWLINSIRTQWPEIWPGILEANNIHPPLHLRVNLLRHTRAEYVQKLDKAGIDATLDPFTETGIQLTDSINVDEIPGFREGEVSVQDFGAQLAADLLGASAGDLVLDACAAPGGKTGHILERTPAICKLVAVEKDGDRLGRVEENLVRLGLQARLVQADVREVSAWWDGEQFDRILLDAPCSATGVIRRHPDIKLLRKPDQLKLLCQTQAELLDAVWPLLKPGGRLLYSTCSILHAESDDQIATFAKKYDDTRLMPITGGWGTGAHCGRYLLPGQGQTDGFYYALAGKTLE